MSSSQDQGPRSRDLYLEAFSRDQQSTWRTLVRTFPFTIGRSEDCDLPLGSGSVSQVHAQIEAYGDALWLKDLGSTNGTYLNGEQLLGEAVSLCHGDIVHFADLQFRLVITEDRPAEGDEETTGPTQAFSKDSFPADLFLAVRRLQRVLSEENAAAAYFQRIVGLSPESANPPVMGVEVLGRGVLDGQVYSPMSLFELARPAEREADLSSAFRRAALREATRLPTETNLFLNTHPAEVRDPRLLLADLANWRRTEPDRMTTLEIHEGAVADLAEFATLAKQLRDLAIGIAFDDFGKGQARLLEIIEVEPDFVKFDRAWIAGLNQVPASRRATIGKMLRIVLDLGIQTIAEGIEEEEEARICRDLGFHWGQGFFFGHPAPLPG